VGQHLGNDEYRFPAQYVHAVPEEAAAAEHEADVSGILQRRPELRLCDASTFLTRSTADPAFLVPLIASSPSVTSNVAYLATSGICRMTSSLRPSATLT
jgi:hypothetical protein